MIQCVVFSCHTFLKPLKRERERQREREREREWEREGKARRVKQRRKTSELEGATSTADRTEGEEGASKLMKGGEGWRRGRRMWEMFNHSGHERILEGRDTTRASRLLRTCLIIPCHLVNAICPTFFFFFFFFLVSGSYLIGSHVCLSGCRTYSCLRNINRKY